MTRSPKMVEYTERKKNETIKKVQEAIDLMKAQGRRITRKQLLQESGVSNAVLSKPYIKEVFEQNLVLMYEKKATLAKVGEPKYVSLLKENDKLRKQIQKIEHKSLEYEIIINNKETYLKDAKQEYDVLNTKYERLLGKWQKLLEHVKRSGVVTPQLEHLFRL